MAFDVMVALVILSSTRQIGSLKVSNVELLSGQYEIIVIIDMINYILKLGSSAKVLTMRL